MQHPAPQTIVKVIVLSPLCWHNTIVYDAAWNITTQSSTIQCSIVQKRTVQYGTVYCSVVQYSAVR